MDEQTDINPNGLRVIKTARTEKAINEAAKAGFRPLLKEVKPSEEIHNMISVYQNKKTGEIELSGDVRWAPGPPEEYEHVLKYIGWYPYSFPSPFAAYLIPKDIKEGELVWLEDIIEDIVAVYGNQGYQPRLEHGEAVWENGDFRILFNPKNDAPVWIG